MYDINAFANACFLSKRNVGNFVYTIRKWVEVDVRLYIAYLYLCIYNADNCIDYLIVWVSYDLVYRITIGCPRFLCAF